MAKKQVKKEVSKPISKAKKPMSQNDIIQPKSASIVITKVEPKKSGHIKAIRAFYDIETHIHRLAGEEWDTTPERADYLIKAKFAE